MSQALRWLWGLAPLALLWGAGNVVLDDAIQQDVGRRAVASAVTAAGEAPGVRPITARVIGRDVAISGEALSADGAAKAMAQLNSEFGIRRALGGLSQVVAQRPYSWSATRQGDAVTLSGFVPDEATAAATLAAAKAAAPGLRAIDRQELAFGAPTGFAAMAQAMLAELPKLASGKVALDDTRFCIEGSAETPDAFLALKSSFERLPRGEFKPVDCPLEPPAMTPYLWGAEKRADGSVAMSGYYQPGEMRARVLEVMRRRFPEPVRIIDETKPALGAQPSFIAAVTRATNDLARLRSGRVALNGTTYTVTGEGPDSFEACEALRLQIAQLDGPDSIAQASIACPPAPPPVPVIPALPELPPVVVPIEPVAPPAPVLASPTSSVPGPAPAPGPAPVADTRVAPPAAPVTLAWRAEKTAQGLVVTGAVPDEATRQAMRAAAADLAKAGAFDDRMETEPNLAKPADYPAATRFAFELLGHMTKGVVSIAGTGLSLAGEAAGEAGWRAIEAAMARSPLPGGLQHIPQAGAPAVIVRPYDLSISADASGVAISGYLPDVASRDALQALVDGSKLHAKLDDTIRIVPGAPAGFAAAARNALTDLLRLDMGSASITDKGVAIRGLTCRDLIKNEVETSAREADASLKVDTVIGLRQTGCVIDPPATCQNDLDTLTKQNTVLFAQGTSVVSLDPATERVIGEAFAILKQCPASRITIEGHANRDGEARGFDNRDLSLRRALRVRDELVRRGIEAGQLGVAGFGMTRPLVPYGAPDARVMNRRVQFTVVK